METQSAESTADFIQLSSSVKESLEAAAKTDGKSLEKFVEMILKQRLQEQQQLKSQKIIEKNLTPLFKTYKASQKRFSVLDKLTEGPLDAEQICRIRTYAGLTQQQFADILGVHKMTVSVWELGKKTPSKRMTAKIKEFCFYAFDGAHGSPVDQLIKDYEALSAEDKKAFMKRIKRKFEESVDLDSNTSLIDATRRNDLSTVRYLLKHNADINAIDMNGRTALMEAGFIGAMDLIQFLVEQGADVNKTDYNGITALSEAEAWGKKEIIQILKKAGAKR